MCRHFLRLNRARVVAIFVWELCPKSDAAGFAPRVWNEQLPVHPSLPLFRNIGKPKVIGSSVGLVPTNACIDWCGHLPAVQKLSRNGLLVLVLYIIYTHVRLTCPLQFVCSCGDDAP